MKEAIWLHHLLDKVFPKRFKLPITVYSDNQGAIALSKDNRFHTRTKHINICFHFVQQYVEDGTLNIMYLPTDRMLADALTKTLPGPQLTKLAGAIGLQTYKTQANCLSDTSSLLNPLVATFVICLLIILVLTAAILHELTTPLSPNLQLYRNSYLTRLGSPFAAQQPPPTFSSYPACAESPTKSLPSSPSLQSSAYTTMSSPSSSV